MRSRRGPDREQDCKQRKEDEEEISRASARRRVGIGLCWHGGSCFGDGTMTANRNGAVNTILPFFAKVILRPDPRSMVRETGRRRKRQNACARDLRSDEKRGQAHRSLAHPHRLPLAIALDASQTDESESEEHRGRAAIRDRSGRTHKKADR